MIDATETQSESEPAPGRLAAWYLRSPGDRDTHVGGVLKAGAVLALCDRGPALPGYSPDPDQVCPECSRVGGTQ